MRSALVRCAQSAVAVGAWDRARRAGRSSGPRAARRCYMYRLCMMMIHAPMRVVSRNEEVEEARAEARVHPRVASSSRGGGPFTRSALLSAQPYCPRASRSAAASGAKSHRWAVAV